MSGRIKGITIEIDGNTTPLQKSLSEVDRSLSNTQRNLKDVNKLLKLDPKNTELLRQKQELLNKAIEDTKKKQEKLKDAYEQAKKAGDTDEARAQQDAIQRELIETEQNLQRLQTELDNMAEHAETSAERAARKIKEFGDAAKDVSEKTRGMSTFAAGAGVAMMGMAYNAGTTADDLLTLSRNTGFSVEELQKMSYASDLIDVSMDQMTGSIEKMTKQMASGNDAFDTLGVSLTNADGSMRSATDVWYDSLEALSQVENATLRDQLSMELFGKSAMDMSGIVDDGGAALKSLGEEAEAAGLILSEDAVADAGAFNDALDSLKAKAEQAFFSAGATLADTLMPALEGLIDTVTQVIEWFAQLDGNTQIIILTVIGLVAAISPVAGLLSGIATIAGVLGTAFTVMTGPIGLVVAAIAALIAAGVAIYQNWDTIMQKGAELWSSITSTWEGIKTTISNAIEGAKNAVSNAIEAIKGLFNFQITWPHIPLPHFSVSGSANPLDWLKQGVPSISVDWYAKAQNQPYLFNQPSIIGVGDVPEVVIGADMFKRMTTGNTITVAPVVNVYGNVEDYDVLAERVSSRINEDLMRKMGV